MLHSFKMKSFPGDLLSSICQVPWVFIPYIFPARQQSQFGELPRSCSWEMVKKRVLLNYCSVTKSCPTLCDPMDCSTPGFPALHHLPEFAQPDVHWVSDAIQSSHPLSPPLMLPSIFPSIKVFSNESTLCIRYLKWLDLNFLSTVLCCLFPHLEKVRKCWILKWHQFISSVTWYMLAFFPLSSCEGASDYCSLPW